MQKNKEKISLRTYLKRYKGGVFGYLATNIMGTIFEFISIITLAEVISFITDGEYSKAIYTTLISLGCMFLTRLSWYFTSIIFNKYGIKIASDMSMDLAKQAFKINSRTYSEYDTGTFASRIDEEPWHVLNKTTDLVNTILIIIDALMIVVYIMVLNWQIGCIIIGIVTICIIIQKIKNRKTKALKERENKSKERIYSLTNEIVRSEKDIKSLGLEAKLSQEQEGRYNDYKKAFIKRSMLETNFWSVRNGLVELASIALLIFAIWQRSKGFMSLATFMLVYTNKNGMYDLIYNLGNFTEEITSMKISIERMFSLYDEDKFESEKFGNISIDQVVGDIEFKDVTFTYKDYEIELEGKNVGYRKQIGESKIFENLSFKIPHNKTVAFVGKSGSGKSTILNIMSKMYEVDSGSVLIDGVNVNDLSKETLRKTFSLVNQSPYIFDMTIRENLNLVKSDATEEEINNALTLASLKEFIDSLPKGLETRVGESGIKLSGGQKQRLAIARALLRKTPIILFDESTSSLDNFAQEEVKRSIDGLKGISTIVIVAHRLSTIKDSDIIFFLDEGKIIAQGTFNELFENNEKFKNMFLAENI